MFSERNEIIIVLYVKLRCLRIFGTCVHKIIVERETRIDKKATT